MRKAVNFRPLCAFALSLALGVLSIGVLGSFAPDKFWRFALLGADVVCFILLISFPVSRKYGIICVAFLAGALALCGALDLHSRNSVSAKSAVVSGRVTSGVTVEDGVALVTLDKLIVDGSSVRGDMYLYFAAPEAFDFDGGDRVVFSADVETEELNCFDSVSVGRYCKNIRYITYADAVNAQSEGTLPLLARWKYNTEKRIYQQTKDDTAALLCGLLFGDKSGMSDELYEATSSAGLSHILAVSGLHIGMLAAALSVLLKKARLRPWVRFSLTLSVLLLYGAVCGFPASVTRATVMYAVAMLAPLLGKKRDAPSALALAATVLLLSNPLNLFSAGFLLSVSAVFGIVLFYPAVCRKHPKAKNTLMSIALLSVITAVSTALISFVFFGKISFVSVVANLFLLPILSFIYIFVLF